MIYGHVKVGQYVRRLGNMIESDIRLVKVGQHVGR